MFIGLAGMVRWGGWGGGGDEYAATFFGSAVHVASLFYLTPSTTALFTWVLFGETLTGLALVGMGLAVFGVWLARS
jgi:drug/metabolite transporter (DMT)-like permease